MRRPSYRARFVCDCDVSFLLSLEHFVLNILSPVPAMAECLCIYPCLILGIECHDRNTTDYDLDVSFGLGIMSHPFPILDEIPANEC